MTELSAFETAAVALKERDTEVLVGKTELAHYATEHDENVKGRPASNFLAHLWGCSAQTVNTLARMFETFNNDEIMPNVPLSLYNAAMEVDDPAYALRLATDYKFRKQELGEKFAKADKKGIWSSSDLRRFYDIKKGRHLSSDSVRGRVPVTEWDVSKGRVAFEGLPLSGEKPEGRVEVVVREVLQE